MKWKYQGIHEIMGLTAQKGTHFLFLSLNDFKHNIDIDIDMLRFYVNHHVRDWRFSNAQAFSLT